MTSPLLHWEGRISPSFIGEIFTFNIKGIYCMELRFDKIIDTKLSGPFSCKRLNERTDVYDEIFYQTRVHTLFSRQGLKS